MHVRHRHINVLELDCGNSSVLAIELLQSCAEPLIYCDQQNLAVMKGKRNKNFTKFWSWILNHKENGFPAAYPTLSYASITSRDLRKTLKSDANSQWHMPPADTGTAQVAARLHHQRRGKWSCELPLWPWNWPWPLGDLLLLAPHGVRNSRLQVHCQSNVSLSWYQSQVFIKSSFKVKSRPEKVKMMSKMLARKVVLQ